ncbi:Susd and RagB outer membrane lipoprotein [Mariniphaga anaerophila]|uniref:Susd and RagB outer membrane lipoprotein n=1 Tax=Mariniphaga anaerophila TaxID=1484053 RepID=A0A1M4VPL0_9BACT|nr:SusD/RagB family nutrient-binding outer membrane lipoprotein [Mariniphaga anaerophila]SHE70976.1 Susd and RagB outer membrane lipoprotein [Mariniphaga anaerophila]
MRKILNILLTSLLFFGAWSCSEDIMDDINKNVNDPTDVGSHLIITDAIVTSAFSITGSDLAFYASVYIEHNVGIWNQSYNAEIRSGEPTSATTYNNSWNSIYQNLYNLKIIIDKCSEGGAEEGNYHTLGIAQVLTAHNLATLTDLMGDVPWTEALQPGIIYKPILDSQESIYTEVKRLLDDAIANFGKESDFAALGTQDFIYEGDIEMWQKFAYGLKARYAMRLSLKTPAYNDVISFADNSFKSSDEQAQFNYNGSTSISPFFKFFTDRDYFGASNSLHEKLADRNDPRDEIFWKINPKGDEFMFAPNGTPVQVQGTYAVSAISNSTAPTYLMSYHEIEFLKAEAYVRLNKLDEAEDALKNALIAAFQKDNIGLTEEDAETYFTDEVLPKFGINPLSEVMNQKYIAFFEEEAVEAYCDYRRLTAMGNNVIKLDNPKNAANQFPQRFTYGNSDVTTNENVRNAYGNGEYIYSEKVWWAGGTR